ncbi:hypothetical protein F5B17DRAFT_422057 [Nemania serpens]|nr:hypothetical protein F5B17DRAFT_422057 [Nemania serpens]
MQFSSSHLLAGCAFLATLVSAIPTPVPVDTAEVIEWAKNNNIEIHNLGDTAKTDSAATLADWAKSNGIDVSTEGDNLVPAPGATDALAAWAQAHNVQPPTVGANFEGGMENY